MDLSRLLGLVSSSLDAAIAPDINMLYSPLCLERRFIVLHLFVARVSSCGEQPSVSVLQTLLAPDPTGGFQFIQYVGLWHSNILLWSCHLT